jgi:hypothetical protein
MRPIVFDVPATVPTAPGLTIASAGPPTLTWTDPTPFNYTTGQPASTLGNPMNEIGFRILRGTGTTGALTQIATALANQTTFTDTTAVAGTTYRYQVVIYNAAGSTPSNTQRVTARVPAITLVQSTSATTTAQAGTLSATLPGAVTVSNLIVVAVSGWYIAPPAVPLSDNLGNTYQIAGVVRAGPPATYGGNWSAIYYAANAKAGATTITFSAPGTGDLLSLVAAEFSNVAAVSPLVASASTTGTGTTASSGTMTSGLLGNLVIGAGEHEGGGVVSMAAGANFSLVAIATADNQIHVPLLMEYRVIPGATSASATMGLSPSNPWGMNGAVFKHK